MLTRNRKKALENKENDGIIIEENTLASIINSKNSNILINQPNSKKRTNESVSILYEEPSPKKFKKDSSYSSLNLKKQEIKNESRSNAFGSSFDQKKKSPKKKPNGNKSIEAFFFPSSKKKLQTSSMQVEEINESDDEEVAETISSGEEVPIETESAPSTPKKIADIFLSKKAKSEMKRQKDMEDLKQYIVQTREENVKLSEGKKIHPFLLPSEKFSSISYKLNQTNEEFPTETHDYRCPYFPTTPHVHQLDSSYDNLLRSQNISSEFWQYFSKPETISHSKSFKFDQNFSLFNLNFEIILNPPVRTSPSINQLYEEFLEYIKCPAIEFEKELIYFNEKLSERFGNQFHSLWTEKYKPDSLTLMLGHGPQLKWLGTFLKTWQNLYSTEARNTVIISGPKGIGKTAAVYAAAQDTGFRILEINPSSKRTGKDIMDLFKEASQSHQLEKWAFADNSNSNSLLFDNNSDSVILFEEIDVLFDEDAGFFKALKDLRKISKRPIIMTCNEITPEISNLFSQSDNPPYHLELGIPFLKDIIYYLELISICEGVFVPLQDLIQLVYYLGRDLRSLTLNLQMWISSDSNRSNFILTSSVEEVHSYIHSLPILSPLTEKLIGLNVLENKNTNLWEVISFRDKISKRETFLFIDSTISNRRLFEIHPIFDSYLNFFPRIVVKKPDTPQLSSPNDSSSITNSQPSKSDLASIDNSSETRVFLEFNNLDQSQMTNVETNSIDSLLEQLEEMSKMSENFSAMNAQCKDSNNYSLLQIGSTLEVLSLQNMNSNLNKTEASSIQFSTEPKPDDWKKTLRSKSELQQILHRIVPTTISSNQPFFYQTKNIQSGRIALFEQERIRSSTKRRTSPNYLACFLSKNEIEVLLQTKLQYSS